MKTVIVEWTGSRDAFVARLRVAAEPMDWFTWRSSTGRGIAVLVRGEYVRLRALQSPTGARGLSPMLYARITEADGRVVMKGRFGPSPVAGVFVLLLLVASFFFGVLELRGPVSVSSVAGLAEIARSFGMFLFGSAVATLMIWMGLDEQDLIVLFLGSTFGFNSVFVQSRSSSVEPSPPPN